MFKVSCGEGKFYCFLYAAKTKQNKNPPNTLNFVFPHKSKISHVGCIVQQIRYFLLPDWTRSTPSMTYGSSKVKNT